jgi:class 3 adenylate cyclase
VLSGHQISRRHAMIHLQANEEYWLVDLGSRNGVSRNGHRVTQPVALKNLDRLEIGGQTLIFRQKLSEATEGEVTKETATDERTVGDHRTGRHWLLLADIMDFTPLSQTMPGDQLAKLVGNWIAECKRVVESHDGEINQYLGDGFLAYWPSPDTSAQKVTDTIKELAKIRGKTSLSFRLVMHNGPVTIDYSITGGKNSLIGPDVNFTFRMEKIAGKLGVDCMATAGAAEKLKPCGNLIPLGEFELKGFDGKFPTFKFEPTA